MDCDRDMIDHLEANGFRVVPADKLQKLTIRKAETLQTFNYHCDVVPIIKSRMAFELAQALLEKNGWTVEDKGDLRIFTMELEVIL